MRTWILFPAGAGGFVFTTRSRGRRYSVGSTYFIVTRLQTGRSGIRISASAGDFCLLENVQTGSGAHPASCSVGTVAVCPEVKRPGREVSGSPRLAIHLRLLPRLRICGTGRLLVLYAFMPRVGKTPPLPFCASRFRQTGAHLVTSPMGELSESFSVRNKLSWKL